MPAAIVSSIASLASRWLRSRVASMGGHAVHGTDSTFKSATCDRRTDPRAFAAPVGPEAPEIAEVPPRHGRLDGKDRRAAGACARARVAPRGPCRGAPARGAREG